MSPVRAGVDSGKYERNGYENNESETVGMGSILCCSVLFLLILLGIALIAAGGTLYHKTNDKSELITKLSEMVDFWEKKCEPNFLQSKMNIKIAVDEEGKSKAVDTKQFTTQQTIQELEDAPEIKVSGLSGKVPVKAKETFGLTAYDKATPERIIARAANIPMRKHVQVPAVCACKLPNCRCKPEDVCGKEMEFRGNEKLCKNKEVCGTCTGNGHLFGVCMVTNFCSGTMEPSPLVGCTYPFQSENQIYSVQKPNNIRVFIFDENSPTMMSYKLTGGKSSIYAPDETEMDNELNAKILLAVGIPVLILASILLIILCACQRWMCFDSSLSNDCDEQYDRESWNDEAIPMHGLNSLPSRADLPSQAGRQDRR